MLRYLVLMRHGAFQEALTGREPRPEELTEIGKQQIVDVTRKLIEFGFYAKILVRSDAPRNETGTKIICDEYERIESSIKHKVLIEKELRYQTKEAIESLDDDCDSALLAAHDMPIMDFFRHVLSAQEFLELFQPNIQAGVGLAMQLGQAIGIEADLPSWKDFNKLPCACRSQKIFCNFKPDILSR